MTTQKHLQKMPAPQRFKNKLQITSEILSLYCKSAISTTSGNLAMLAIARCGQEVNVSLPQGCRQPCQPRADLADRSERFDSEVERKMAGFRMAKPSHITRPPSVQATAPKVVGDDDIGDCVKDELDVVGVCGTGDVCINLLISGFVLALILRLDECNSLHKGVWTCVLRKANAQSRFLNFVLKYVLLI